MTLYAYTAASPRVYPEFGILAEVGDVVDFGQVAMPNDGRWGAAANGAAATKTVGAGAPSYVAPGAPSDGMTFVFDAALGQFVTRQPADPTVDALEGDPAVNYSHSFNAVTGPGADPGQHAMELVSTRCRTQPLVNLGVSGTYSHTILGVIQANQLPNTRGVVFLGGFIRNDQNLYTNATPNYATTAEVARSMFAYCTARARLGLDSAAVGLGPGWTVSAGVATGGVGAYADFSWAGDAAFIAWSAVTGTGGTFTVADTTGTVLTTVTTGGYGAAFTGVTKISGLGVGAHTVRLTVTAGNPGLVELLIPAATPPLIVWELEPSYNPSPTVVSGGDLATTVSKQYQQTIIDQVLPQFDRSRIVVVTEPPTWDRVNDVVDGIHPNARGHRKIASWAIARMRAAGVTFMQGLNWMTGSAADPSTYTVPAIAYNRPGSTAPAAATAVTAAADAQVLLSWTRGTDGGASITNQAVQATADNGVTFIDVVPTVTPGTSLLYILSGLTPGTSYKLRVGATNANGTTWSALSAAVVAGAAATVYSKDDFGRADSPDTPGSTETGGFPWLIAQAGDVWGVSGGRLIVNAVAPATRTNLSTLVFDDGQNAGTFEVTLVGARGNRGIYVCGNTAGTNGYLIYANAAGTLLFAKQTTAAGGLSAIAGPATPVTIVAGDRIRVIRTTAGVFTIKVNGVTVHTFTDTSYSGTRHGVYAGSVAQTFDGFLHTSSLVTT